MEYCCKTPVALIFFNRPETLEKVFEKVRKAKPSKLFLVQDGPRNKEDAKKILECRKIVENIDWQCEVIKDYSEVNLGCGVRPQSGISNAFKHTEQLIILEDDCIPSDTFFRYCDEMLEKYKDDQRICYISGLNHFETWDCAEGDYFFTKTGAIWGWATWKRAWSQYYDYYVEAIENEKLLELVKRQVANKFVAQSKIAGWKKANASLKNNEKLSYWDTQWGFVKLSQNMLVIVPKYNQIHNVGVGMASTHAKQMKECRYIKYKNFVFIPTYNLEFPIKHPKHCVCDTIYDDLVYKCSQGNSLKKVAKTVIKKLRNK